MERMMPDKIEKDEENNLKIYLFPKGSRFTYNDIFVIALDIFLISFFIIGIVTAVVAGHSCMKKNIAIREGQGYDCHVENYFSAECKKIEKEVDLDWKMIAINRTLNHT